MDAQPDETMPASSALIVAGMRFSILTEKAIRNWVGSRRSTFAETREMLFSEARLAARFRMFEAMTLPFFRHEAKRDPDFRLCILTSTLMPRPWRDHLETITGDIRQIDLVPVSPTGVFQREFDIYIRQQLRPEHTLVCTTRIDDDDAMQAGHMKSLRAQCLPENVGKVISHPFGIYMTADADGVLYARPRKYLNNAFGIAFLSEPGSLRTIYNTGSHAKLDKVYPVVEVPKRRAWIRSIHPAADTAKERVDVFDGKWTPVAENAEQFAKRFPFLDLDTVARAFAAR